MKEAIQSEMGVVPGKGRCSKGIYNDPLALRRRKRQPLVELEGGVYLALHGYLVLRLAWEPWAGKGQRERERERERERRFCLARTRTQERERELLSVCLFTDSGCLSVFCLSGCLWRERRGPFTTKSVETTYIHSSPN